MEHNSKLGSATLHYTLHALFCYILLNCRYATILWRHSRHDWVFTWLLLEILLEIRCPCVSTFHHSIWSFRLWAAYLWELCLSSLGEYSWLGNCRILCDYDTSCCYLEVSFHTGILYEGKRYLMIDNYCQLWFLRTERLICLR